jgi:uncharacterized repeat protein (TIGR03803 family)
MAHRISGYRQVCRILLIGLVLAGVFSMRAQAQTFSLLHVFEGGVEGRYPYAGLTLGTDGNLYGTTAGVGEDDYGTVFKMTPSGTLTILHTFSNSDGAHPTSRLTLGSDGNFYGVTPQGGDLNTGTVFKISRSGAFKLLHSFGAVSNDGIGPGNALTQGSDGNFYGTTGEGGIANQGTVYKITPAGAVTVLYSFSGGDDGKYPSCTLAQGSDGNFYGATFMGGHNNLGTIFKITPSGTLTTLHAFTTTDGEYPVAGVIPGPGGNFYGTTAGGAGHSGSVFKITPSGAFTNLYSFNKSGDGGDGVNPGAGLAAGPDGNFYGTTYVGGTKGCGTVFKVTPSGAFTPLYSFDVTSGANPSAGLTLGADGALYGTTYYGGDSNLGAIFRLKVPIPNTLASMKISPESVIAGQDSKATVTFTTTINSGTLTLKSSDASVTVPASITFRSSLKSYDFSIHTSAVSAKKTVTITASYNSSTASAAITVNPTQVKGLSLLPNNVVSGQTSTGTVTLNAPAPTGGVSVSLSSSGSAASVPSTMKIAAGETTGTFTIKTAAVTSEETVTIKAALNGASSQATLNVKPVKVTALALDPTSVLAGQTSTGTVTLSSPALSGGTVVSLASSISGVTVPATVKVSAGKTTATFAVKTSPQNVSSTATITATLNDSNITRTLSVKPTGPTELTLTPSTIQGGSSSQGVVKFSGAVSGDGTLTLKTGTSSVTVPASISVAAGRTSITFKATAAKVTTTKTVKITATFNSISVSATLTLNP